MPTFSPLLSCKRCFNLIAASSWRPAKAKSATSPCKASSQKRRRLSPSGMACFTRCRKRLAKLAKEPYSGGIKASSLTRSNLANTGDAPPDEIAATMGERSMMAGKIKLHNSGQSTTLTGILRAWAAWNTCSLTRRSEVAPMINLNPSTSSGAKCFCFHSILCWTLKSARVSVS